MTSTKDMYFTRYQVNLAYQNVNIPGKPWSHWGRVVLGDVTQEEAIRRTQTLKRLFEPEGLQVELSGWVEMGKHIPIE